MYACEHWYAIWYAQRVICIDIYCTFDKSRIFAQDCICGLGTCLVIPRNSQYHLLSTHWTDLSSRPRQEKYMSIIKLHLLPISLQLCLSKGECVGLAFTLQKLQQPDQIDNNERGLLVIIITVVQVKTKSLSPKFYSPTANYRKHHSECISWMPLLKGNASTWMKRHFAKSERSTSITKYWSDHKSGDQNHQFYYAIRFSRREKTNKKIFRQPPKK